MKQINDAYKVVANVTFRIELLSVAVLMVGMICDCGELRMYTI